MAHPDDDRYRSLIGAEVVVPVFGMQVPIVGHPRADPDRGTGIAMICAFGDTTDVIWWRELDLPLRVVIQRDGRFQPEVPGWLTDGTVEPWPAIAGATAADGRVRIVEQLRVAGHLVAEPRPIRHEVKFFEKGERPPKAGTSGCPMGRRRQGCASCGGAAMSRETTSLCCARLVGRPSALSGPLGDGQT